MADTWESAGEPEPLPAGGTVAAANPYVSLEDDGPPQPLRQMPTPQGEADYQQWVNQHTSTQDPTQFQTPSMGSRSVTVDPYGNGVGVDLRAMYQNHAMTPFQGFDANPLNPPSGPKTLDPSPDLLNQYALPSSGQLTKDSIYAQGQPDSNLGSWGEDENGNPQYNQPGWEPLTTTQKIMGAAKAQGFGPMAFSGSNKFEGANDQGLGGLLWRLAPIFGVTSAPAYITKPDQMEREQKLRDETDWQKAQSQRLKAARKAGDAATVDKLREQMRADAKIKGANERAEAQERSQKRAAAHSDKTSQLLDHVGSLVDQGGTRAQLEQRVKVAGYPALAGLLGSLPETLTPDLNRILRGAA